MDILLAIILGGFFGYVLQRVGAADPDLIIGMLGLRNLHLMKVIFAGIGLASIALFLALMLGIINPDHISIKSSYLGVLIGGAVLGVGWSVGGFCPGTGLVGLGAGRKDAAFFVLGGLVGAGLYTMMYASLADSAMMQELFGGAITLADTGNAISVFGVDTQWLGIILGIVFVAIGGLLPERLLGKTLPDE